MTTITKEADSFDIGKTVNKKWVVESHLGEGCCGVVYKVHDVKEPRKKAAMKIEFKDENIEVLKNETKVLRQLLERNHVVQLLDSGKRTHYSYLVMTLFGRNLSQLKKDSGLEHMTDRSVTRVGIHALYAIKQIHEIGYVHRDVKPQNFVIGRRGRESRMVFLIDYGLARNYVVWTDAGSRIRKPRPKALLRGTTRYCSPAVHERKEQGRKDDLWSLIYLLVELHVGLPWVRKPEPETKKIKEETTDEELLKNCPKEWLAYMTHIRSLSYESRPDYKALYDIFTEAMTRLDVTFADLYDWEDTPDDKTENKKRITVAPQSHDKSKRQNVDNNENNLAGGGTLYPNTVPHEFESNDIRL